MTGFLPFIPGYFYFVSLGLQAICAIHCVRRGNQQKWIYLIVFVPLIGCLAYFFTEIVRARDVRHVQTGVSTLISPVGRIRRLENNLKFSNTFNNRIMLADAYLAAGRTDEATDLYTSSLIGAFTENEHVLKQLIVAYFDQQRYAELIPLAKKIYNRPQFTRSKAHILYARALEYTGNSQEAEQEFRKMKGRFADFEARYQYGLFLQGSGRAEEAQVVFEDITDEAYHLSSRERRDNRTWIVRAKEELKKV